jgi:hypothetical protein
MSGGCSDSGDYRPCTYVGGGVGTMADWATQLGQLECIKVILRRPDVDVLRKNAFGTSPVTEALKNGREDIAGMDVLGQSCGAELWGGGWGGVGL